MYNRRNFRHTIVLVDSIHKTCTVYVIIRLSFLLFFSLSCKTSPASFLFLGGSATLLLLTIIISIFSFHSSQQGKCREWIIGGRTNGTLVMLWRWWWHLHLLLLHKISCPRRFDDRLMMTMRRHNGRCCQHRLLLLLQLRPRRCTNIGHRSRSTDRCNRSSSTMKATPNFLKKALLAPKLHTGSLLIMARLELREGIPNFNWALSAPHHVIVQHIEGFAGIAESL